MTNTAQPDMPRLTEPLSVSTAVAAKAVGLSEGTIRNLYRADQLRIRRVGRRVLIPLDALKELVFGSMPVS